MYAINTHGDKFYAITTHGDKFVRINAFFDIQNGKEEFRIDTNCGGEYRSEKFSDFSKAAKAYRDYEKKIKEEKAAA